MAITTRGQIPAEVSAFYDRTLLERGIPSYVHTRFAQVKDIPRMAGVSTVKFRRYASLTAQTTPLAEGITPSGSELSVTDITATVEQYGDYVTVTDVVTYESQDAVLMEAAELLGEQAADTIDQITRDVLAAGTNVYYAGTANTATVEVAAGDNITAALVKKAVRLLKQGNAKRVTRMVNPSTGYGTEPIPASFIGIVHGDTTYDLEGLTGWTPVEKYSSQATVMEDEVGKLGQVRFIETNNAKVLTGLGTAGADVYATLIMGANAYGTTRISGEALKNIVKPLGSAGTADPLDQRATSGWKATFVAKILDNDWIVRIEHTVSA